MVFLKTLVIIGKKLDNSVHTKNERGGESREGEW